MAKLCLDIWSHQRRLVCFGFEVRERPVFAGNAMPQGDPFGPLALALWMTAGVVNLKRRVEQQAAAELPAAAPGRDLDALVQRVLGTIQVYLDDRTAVVRDVLHAKQHVDIWTEWSSKCGLKENLRKLQVVVRDVTQQAVAVETAARRSKSSGQGTLRLAMLLRWLGLVPAGGVRCQCRCFRLGPQTTCSNAVFRRGAIEESLQPRFLVRLGCEGAASGCEVLL
jgi:hypothetical protein